MQRRQFVQMGVLGSMAAGTLLNSTAAMAKPKEQKLDEFGRPEAIASDITKAFVVAAHGDPETVKSMLTENPRMANAVWDWGGGDFESALGGASHMRRTDIGEILLDHGARMDVFYAAMTGQVKVVSALMETDLGILQVKGPHGISLLFHAILSGKLDFVMYLNSHGAKIENSNLRAASIANSYQTVEWLLVNGAIYDDKDVFMGQNLATIAREQGKAQIADLLESSL